MNHNRQFLHLYCEQATSINGYGISMPIPFDVVCELEDIGDNDSFRDDFVSVFRCFSGEEVLYNHKEWIILPIDETTFSLRPYLEEWDKKNIYFQYMCEISSNGILVKDSRETVNGPLRPFEYVQKELSFNKGMVLSRYSEYFKWFYNIYQEKAADFSFRRYLNERLRGWREFIEWKKLLLAKAEGMSINVSRFEVDSNLNLKLVLKKVGKDDGREDKKLIEAQLKKNRFVMDFYNQDDSAFEYYGSADEYFKDYYEFYSGRGRDYSEEYFVPEIVSSEEIGNVEIALEGMNPRWLTIKIDFEKNDKLLYPLYEKLRVLDGDELAYDSVRIRFQDRGERSLLRQFENNLSKLLKIDSLAVLNTVLWLFDIENVRNQDKDIDASRNEEKGRNTRKFKKLNEEQEKAVNLIINTDDISFILGPPGTGKTSVIAEAVYKLVSRGKSVLIASQSNDAIDNALDRLPKTLDVRTMRAVNKEDYYDQSHFFSNLTGNMVAKIPELISENIERIDQYLERYNKAVKPYKKLYDILFVDEEIETLSSNDFVSYLKENIDENVLTKVVEIVREVRSRDTKIIFKYDSALRQLQNIRFLEGNEDVLDWRYNIYVRMKSLFTDFLELDKFSKEQDRLLDLRKTFTAIKDCMRDYDRDEDIEIFCAGYNNQFRSEMLKTVNVCGVTCTANIDKLLEGRSRVFDYVIIDEVSKATLPELLGSIFRGRHCVLIGDHHQLPPVFREDDADDISAAKLSEFKELVSNTVFKELFDKASSSNKCMLKKQYRMHNEISDIAISEFYLNKSGKSMLENGLGKSVASKQKSHGITVYDRNQKAVIMPDHHIYWIDSTPIFEDGSLDVKSDRFEKRPTYGTSIYNTYEKDIIIKLLKDINFGATRKMSVGVISFYAEQTRILREAVDKFVSEFENLEIDANTVDRFQGQERDIIIVSLVRSTSGKIPKNNAFFRAYERINVAFSRAKSLLIIVGSERFSEAQNVTLDYLDIGCDDVESENPTNVIVPVYAKIISKIKDIGCFIQGNQFDV